MDISVDDSKKSGSLDLWSVSVKKSRTSDRKPRGGKRIFGVNQAAELTKTKNSFPSEKIESNLAGTGRKRRRKEVTLSSFGLSTKKLHNGSVGHNLESSSSNLQQLGNDHESPGKSDHESYKVCFNSENRDRLDGDVIILKRPRVAPKWIETSISNHERTGNKNINKSSTKNLPMYQELNDKHEEINELNQTDRDITVPSTSREDATYISTNDVKIGSKNNDGSSILVDDGPLVHDSDVSVAKFQEDDEENLEENAARMLSSRFNPSCAGFSRSGDSYIKNGVKVSQLEFDHGTFKGSPAGSSSVDSAIRNLRPRSQNAKSVARKRRHFYEVCSRDIDPSYIVKQRIRVFWPLDKSWYFGLVKGYDPVSKLHHIKYDDRDEEWINLQNERFKLLLFPSEASGKFGIKKRKRQREVEDTEDSCIGNLLDSEPIVSWLSRATHHVKAGSSIITKKPNKVIMPEGVNPSILLEPQGCTSPNPSNGNKLLLKGDMLELPCDCNVTKFPDSKRPIGSNSAELRYVYYRKRFRTRKEILDRKPEQDANPNNSLCSTSSISSVADATRTKLKLSLPILRLMTLTMIFSLPLQYLNKLAFGIGSCWPSYAITILQSSELVCAWPIVYMEIVFLDNNSGLKILFFGGCLRRAVSLFCLIMSIFDHFDMSTWTKEEVVLTSIEFEISHMCYWQRKLLFVFNSLSNIENSKWQYLEDQLKRHCTKGEVALANCMFSDITDFAGAQYQKLFKGFVGSSCLDMVCNTIANELGDSNSNSVVHYVYEEHFPPRLYSFSFPSLLFSHNLHLKLLIEKTAASLCSGKSTSVSLQECPDITDNLTANDSFQTEDSSDYDMGVRIESQTSLGEGAVVLQETKTDVLLPSTINDSSGDMGNKVKSETAIQYETSCLTGPLQGADETDSLRHEHSSSVDKAFNAIGESSWNTVNSQIKVFDQIDEHLNDKTELTAHCATNLVIGMTGQSFHGPTARRSVWRRSRNTSVPQTSNHRPKLWADDFLSNDLSHGYKKPRSQVSYSVFSNNYELDTKSQNSYQKSQLNKKIKSSKENKLVDCTVSSQGYMETLACDANILVSDGTKGWREYGTEVILHSDDQKNWMICVKLSGSTKYVYKVNQNLQPGITNRYTHAMMWRGGKDWTLEFTDRSQWSLFKQMHEECYNRNIRAASIKNIPIPGVRLVADVDDRTIAVPFIRSLSKYYRQVGTEIDFALDPSHVLYDIDSEDEAWISRSKDCLEPKGSRIPKITEEMFERVMDMLEKLAYSQQRHEFTNVELDEFMADVGPSNIVNAIHEHWRIKRHKKGVPLVRQFQPPLWEHYQKQLKEWESTMSKMPSQPEGGNDKACFNKKPPMFAFCLRPRGLKLPNKGSKHKSHKKLTLSGHHNTFVREKDYIPSFGRKSDGISVGDEKALVDNTSYESSDSIHGLQSLSSFSTRDTSSTESLSDSEGSDRYPDPKPFRSCPIKMGNLHPPRDFQTRPFSLDQRTKRSVVDKWKSELLGRPNTKQKLACFKRHQPDINEFTLRDASSAAQHALNMAKLKREKANWLLHKADLAVHRATVALMTAEAIKASEKDIIGDG